MTNHTEEATRPFIVCPSCEGKGHHGPGHVYTEEDRAEYDPEDFAELMEQYRAGMFDVRCEECSGLRVVKAECACDDCEETRREIAEMDAQWRAEIAFGC